MKLINRDKFELTGYNNAVSNMTPKGLVYNCTTNKARCNLLEYIWFSSEWMIKKKANVFWMILFLICPWYDQLYYIVKNRELNLDMTLGEFVSLILMILFTLSGIGFIFAIFLSLKDMRKQRKSYLKTKTVEDLHKMGERTNFE